MLSFCESCFNKQRKIDELTEEVTRLKAKLRYLERKEKEGYFGSSTPSSKVPHKENAIKENQKKQGGAKQGHPGHGRRVFKQSQADRVVELKSEVGDRCPNCGDPLKNKGRASRPVIDLPPMKKERIAYTFIEKYCERCHRTFRPKPPGVLPKSFYGNQLITTAATMHYLHGIPIGRVCGQIGIGNGSLIKIFHRLANMFTNIPAVLIEQYRNSHVKHADETGWRNNGQSGYAWLFATERISIFFFRKTRSASVVHEALGTDPLSGTLVVDRYNAYNQSPCAIQYCYEHLNRDVEDTQKKFPDNPEVNAFVETMSPLLAKAMSLRNLPISDEEFYKKAAEIKSKIIDAVHSPAQHLAIRHIQEIFHEKAHRLYHWASDRRIPAENNLAERDLRPTVIARKVSFGSQSDEGAKTREIMMTVLHTLKKRTTDPAAGLKNTLDCLAKDQTLDPYKLLFPDDTS